MLHDDIPALMFLPDGRQLTVKAGERALNLLAGDRLLLEVAQDGDTWHVLTETEQPHWDFALWALASWVFARAPALERLSLRLGGGQGVEHLLRQGLLSQADDGSLGIERAAFWQLGAPWLKAANAGLYPQQMRLSEGRYHPLRPPKPVGEVYRRFDARLGNWISLRALDIDLDLARFHRWQNHPRVAQFWQESGSLQHHQAYLLKRAADPHTLTLIGCFDDQPFAYFEAYWAKEDRIAPFYPAGDYDRGIHMLVGEDNYRGPHRVRSWLNALVHYLLLDDARTQRVVAEPRADNARMIGYMQNQGFWNQKLFDFPHKRAALMVQSREKFFAQCDLC
jgi:acetyl CoA:N6-hydroxylysine acetyl transferase